MRIKGDRAAWLILLSSAALSKSCCESFSTDRSSVGRGGNAARCKPTPRLSSTATAATPENTGNPHIIVILSFLIDVVFRVGFKEIKKDFFEIVVEA